MYHSCTPQHNKEVILSNLAKSDGTTRVVFATVALGMGVDIKNVQTVVHYRAPRSLDDSFQESGRTGRSSVKAHFCSILEVSRLSSAKAVTPLMTKRLLVYKGILKTTHCAIAISSGVFWFSIHSSFSRHKLL